MRSVLWAAALMLILMLSTPATAKELRVGIYGYFGKLHFGSKGKMRGMEPDLARRLARRLGMRAKLIDTRAQLKMGTLDALSAGHIDIALNAITPTPERAKRFDLTKPYATLHLRLIGPPGAKLGSLDALKGRTIVVPSAFARAQLASVLPQARLVVVQGLKEVFDHLKEGPRQLGVAEDEALRAAVKDKLVVVLGPPLAVSPVVAAVRLGEGKKFERLIEQERPALQVKWGLYRSVSPKVEVKRWQEGRRESPSLPELAWGRSDTYWEAAVCEGGAWLRYTYCRDPGSDTHEGLKGMPRFWSIEVTDGGFEWGEGTLNGHSSVARIRGRTIELDGGDLGAGQCTLQYPVKGPCPGRPVGQWSCEFRNEGSFKAYYFPFRLDGVLPEYECPYVPEDR